MPDPFLTRDLDFLLGPAIASRISSAGSGIMERAKELQAALNRAGYPGDQLLPLPALLSTAVDKLDELVEALAQCTAGHRETQAALGLREAEIRELQGNLAETADELRQLRGLKTEVTGITASPATGRALAFALHDFVQRLRERTREAEQDANRDVRRAAMFEKRCARYEAWFALPPDQRHPLGPELSPPADDGPLAGTDAGDPRLWNPAPKSCLRCWSEALGKTTEGDRVRAAEALGEHTCPKGQQAPDLPPFHPAAPAIRLGPPPEMVIVGKTESGPPTPGRLISSGAELRAWVSPKSDPKLVAALGLQPPPPATWMDHMRAMGQRVGQAIDARLRELADGQRLAVSYGGARFDGQGRASIEEPEFVVLNPGEAPPLGKGWEVFGPMTADLRERALAAERERPRMVECPACDSNGSVGGTDACYNCGGTGAIEAR